MSLSFTSCIVVLLVQFAYSNLCNASEGNMSCFSSVRSYTETNLSLQSQLVNITVSQSPKIVDQVERLNHPEGTNATLTCSIGSGELNGLTYEWLKDDRKIVASSKFRIALLPENVNSILRVIDLKPEDSATYSCVARNAFGQDKISTKLFVKVQLKWLHEPKRDVNVPVGKPLHVPCSATGQPSPKIVWTKLDDSTNRSLGGELRFQSTSQDDSGLYECRASNGVEKDLVSRFRLNVLGK